ncbi:MAG: hypothetical protein Tsb0020_20620 [Haliangiales bacterium]
MTQRPTADDVDAKLARLYGPGVAEARGIIHITAVWADPAHSDDPSARYRTIAINDAAPTSDCDFFALQAARARADAIVTTGRNLRQEPELSHAFQGPMAAALADWRHKRLGKRHPARLLVLTSGRDVPLDHRALRAAGPATIYTATKAIDAIDALRAKQRASDAAEFELVGAAAPSIHRAIDYLRAAHGCQTIVVEAGPSTARALYSADPVQVDELLLSVFHGPTLAERARAGAFLSEAALRARLPHRSPGAQVVEHGAPWCFWRYTRVP